MFSIFFNLEPEEHIPFIFCMMRREEHTKSFCCMLKHHDCLREKHLCDCLSQEQNKPLTLAHGTAFSLERRADKPWLFRLRYLADIFSKNGQRKSLSLQEKQMTAFVDIQNWSFQVENWDFGKLLPATGSLTASQYIMSFLRGSVMILTNVSFECYVMKFVTFGKYV